MWPSSILHFAIKPVALLALTLSITIFTIFFSSPSQSAIASSSMASRSFILWLHGLGDSGPANEPIKSVFSSPQLANTRWSFPSAPFQPVTCNNGAKMPSWFDIPEIPITANSPVDESSLLKAVQSVHSMIDKELAAGTDPKNVFLCGFSQGGALTLASTLLYPKTLGGVAVFSGWVPFNSTSSIIEQITAEAKRTLILWSHGTADGTVLFEAGQAGPPFLQQLGMNCEFKAYPGLGHSINNQELKHVESWINSRLQSSS
ncbi:putative carboxylesterase [Helianthus anomalus]